MAIYRDTKHEHLNSLTSQTNYQNFKIIWKTQRKFMGIPYLPNKEMNLGVPRYLWQGYWNNHAG